MSTFETMFLVLIGVGVFFLSLNIFRVSSVNLFFNNLIKCYILIIVYLYL